MIDLTGEEEHCKVMRTLYLYQKRRELCDLTLVSCDGHELDAHAGVLAAASLVLRKELEKCERGLYTVVTPFKHRELLTLIHFAYTGKNMTIERYRVGLFKEMGLLRSENEMSHMKIVVKLLHKFAAKGLFCNTACCRRNGETEPTQSYVLAVKHSFLTNNVPKNSMVIAHEYRKASYS